MALSVYPDHDIVLHFSKASNDRRVVFEGKFQIVNTFDSPQIFKFRTVAAIKGHLIFKPNLGTLEAQESIFVKVLVKNPPQEALGKMSPDPHVSENSYL